MFKVEKEEDVFPFRQFSDFSVVLQEFVFQEITSQSKCFRKLGGFKVCKFLENRVQI